MYIKLFYGYVLFIGGKFGNLWFFYDFIFLMKILLYLIGFWCGLILIVIR